MIDLTEQEESEYWDVVSAVFEGRDVDSVLSNSSVNERPATPADSGINHKVSHTSPLTGLAHLFWKFHMNIIINSNKPPVNTIYLLFLWDGKSIENFPLAECQRIFIIL